MTRATLALVVLTLAVAGVGCPCDGTVNSSPNLRWWLFSHFGASSLCPEMLKRGVPLKMAQTGDATIGRFFPAQCSVSVDDAKKAIIMNAAGTGYVVLPFTRRVGFSVQMGVEYLPDFRLEGDATYVWGKFSRFTLQPDMRILGVENGLVNLATQTPAGNVATVIGNGLVQSEIGKGFTVVRQDDGDDFTLGHLEPPAKPKRQFKPGKDRILIAGDRTTIASQAREFLGPLVVEDSGVALFLRAQIVSGPQLTYVLVERSVAEPWRRAYETAQPLTPPPGGVITGGTLTAETRLTFPVTKGTYYLVVENASAIPLLGDNTSTLSYSLELGDH